MLGGVITLLTLGIIVCIGIAVFIALMPVFTYFNTKKILRRLDDIQTQLKKQQDELKNALYKIHENTKNTPK